MTILCQVTRFDAIGDVRMLKGSSEHKTNSSIDHFIAGIGGGFSSTLILHPIDLLKVRMQVGTNSQTYSRLIHNIYEHYGLKGFYRGATPNILGNSISWGFYLYSFNFIDGIIRQKMQLPPSPIPLSTFMNWTVAFFAGFMVVYISNPIWVIKVRMCQTNKIDKRYSTLRDSIKTIYYSEGLNGFYKGCIPGILSVSHGCFMMSIYQELKWKVLSNRHNQPITNITEAKLSSLEILMISSISKIGATILTYPFQIIRTRLQNSNRNYNGIVDVIRKTITSESIGGLYKGLIACLIRVTPSACITFITYEGLIQILQTI